MIASRPDRGFAAALIAVLACGWLAGCHTPGARPITPALDEDIRLSARVPDVADHAAADLAAAALISDRDRAQQMLSRLKAIDTVLVTGGELPTGLVPVATDLVNATLESDRAYREATGDLLEEDDLDPALRERLRQAERDDPLVLADARIRDARIISFARAFNAVAEPIGQSILTLTMAPFRLAQSLAHYAIAVYGGDKLPLQRRQALAHWKEFVTRYPNSPESDELRLSIEQADIGLAETRYQKSMMIAERALEAGRIRLALVYADRALYLVPEDSTATALRDEADRQLLALRAKQHWSIEGVAELAPAPPAARSLSVALLNPGGDIAGAARELMEANPEGSYQDEAQFAEALALGEAGQELEMWELLEEVASLDQSASNMARHARSRVRDPGINSYGAFSTAKRLNRQSKAKWLLLGPWAHGLPDRRIPTPLEFVIDLPAIAQSIVSTPIRLIQLPWLGPQPAERLAAVYGRRYLELYPDGERVDEVRNWLSSFERKRENWVGVYQLALDDSEGDSAELAELEEQAAVQALQIAGKEQSRGRRNAMYRRVAQQYPDTAAGKRAGRRARDEILNATPQHIRISRGFLVENPEFAGPRGLGLNAHLLDENHANSELHPNGVILIGGRTLEFHFIGPTGDEDDPPLTVYQEVSDEHFARIVAELEEISFHNSLVDTDDALASDANRDVMFERARVGLADEIDLRPDAESTYSYLGMRERYGMVRARESILPFDLVFQGSLSTLSLGAFPRIHTPRETPDAFLYR